MIGKIWTNRKPRKVENVEFAGNAFVQIVLSAINPVSGFVEGVVRSAAGFSLQNAAGFRCKTCVDGSCFEKLWPWRRK